MQHSLIQKTLSLAVCLKISTIDINKPKNNVIVITVNCVKINKCLQKEWNQSSNLRLVPIKIVSAPMQRINEVKL